MLAVRTIISSSLAGYTNSQHFADRMLWAQTSLANHTRRPCHLVTRTRGMSHRALQAQNCPVCLWDKLSSQGDFFFSLPHLPVVQETIPTAAVLLQLPGCVAGCKFMCTLTLPCTGLVTGVVRNVLLSLSPRTQPTKQASSCGQHRRPSLSLVPWDLSVAEPVTGISLCLNQLLFYFFLNALITRKCHCYCSLEKGNTCIIKCLPNHHPDSLSTHKISPCFFCFVFWQTSVCNAVYCFFQHFAVKPRELSGLKLEVNKGTFNREESGMLQADGMQRIQEWEISLTGARSWAVKYWRLLSGC